MKTLVVILAASALFAQSNRSSPDAAQILQRSIVATERSWEAREHYVFTERDEDRRLDSTGRVKSADVDISKVILIGNASLEQLVEHNGRPPSAEEKRKQTDKLDKLMRETRAEQQERLREQEENRSFVREVPKGFDFKLVGEEVIDGRPAYILRATPRAGYHAHGKYGKLMCKVE